LRICRVLAINPEELTEDETLAEIRAKYLGMFARLGQMQSELHDFADRLVPILFEVAAYLSNRHEEEFLGTGEAVERALVWIETDWGQLLNSRIHGVMREHDGRVEGKIFPKYDGSNYQEVLKRVSEHPWERTSDEPDGGTDE
jgi:hypothetical protein